MRLSMLFVTDGGSVVWFAALQQQDPDIRTCRLMHMRNSALWSRLQIPLFDVSGRRNTKGQLIMYVLLHVFAVLDT